MTLRKMVVSGSFYPEEEEEIKRYIEHFNKGFSLEGKLKLNTKAIIVPHAGYIYSGFTANLAYNLASKKHFKRVIIIGPSHRVYLEGISSALYEAYETPLGNIPIDLDFSKNLIKEYDFVNFDDEVHLEHSTETQAPFIKYYFDDRKLVELIYGNIDFKDLSKLIDKILEDENNLVVISTDLSHFYTLKEANILDNICLEAIASKDLKKLDSGCEACGMIGIKAIINSCINKNLETKILHYCTSYETSKDDKNVVGYTSVLVGEEIL